MKNLRNSLERLFGTDPESTPAVPSLLREVAAAESGPRRFEYPLVASVEDLPPDLDSPEVPQELPDFAASDSAPSRDSGSQRLDGADDSLAGTDPGGIFVREPVALYQRQPGNDDFLSGLAACDPRAFSKRLQRGVREIHDGNPVAFYTAAGISRSAYSRLVSHPDRHPAKDTVLSMAAALHMSLPDAESFLRLAGYALSPHIPADLVWHHCFQKGIHDLADIRNLLAQASPG